MEEELQKKETQWRLTSLKRHAETNKLEQAIKVSQKNEGLLKKKADMLELSNPNPNPDPNLNPSPNPNPNPNSNPDPDPNPNT